MGGRDQSEQREGGRATASSFKSVFGRSIERVIILRGAEAGSIRLDPVPVSGSSVACAIPVWLCWLECGLGSSVACGIRV